MKAPWHSKDQITKIAHVGGSESKDDIERSKRTGNRENAR